MAEAREIVNINKIDLSNPWQKKCYLIDRKRQIRISRRTSISETYYIQIIIIN